MSIDIKVLEDNPTIDVTAGEVINVVDYNLTIHKPSINGNKLQGDKSSSDLGLADKNHTHKKAEITDFAHTHKKADITDFAHTHDDRYYLKSATDSAIDKKATELGTLITASGHTIDLVMDSATYELKALLYDGSGKVISTSTVIDLPLETLVLDVSYNSSKKAIIIKLENGTTKEVPVGDLVSGLVSDATFNAKVKELNTSIGTKANSADVYDKSSVDTKLSTKANSADVYDKTTLDTKLNGKSNTSHTHTKSQITDFAHTHTKSQITDFAHTHKKADITDFAHTHKKEDITDFAHNHDDRYYQKSETDSAYIKSATASGRTITFTKGDGTKSTLTTQDTTYGVATQSSNGLLSSADKKKLDELSGQTTALINRIYPVGAIYLTYNDNNPSDFLGGTWERFGQGRTLIGEGTGNDGSTSKTFGANSTGGEYNHKLTISEMPKHMHGTAKGQKDNDTPNITDIHTTYQAEISIEKGSYYLAHTLYTGGDNSHNNIQPYTTVYFWRRTA